MGEKKIKKQKYTLLDPVQHQSTQEFEEKQQRRADFLDGKRSQSKYWAVRNIHWILTVAFMGLIVYLSVIVYKDEIHKVFNSIDFRITDCVIEKDGEDYLIHITYKNPSSKEQSGIEIYRIVGSERGYASVYDLDRVTAIVDPVSGELQKKIILPGYATTTVTYRISGEDMPQGKEMTIQTQAYEPQEYVVQMPE